MSWLRTRSSLIRVALAMALLLASLAGARLQGQMAGGAAQAAALGILCSGEQVPQGDGAPAAHVHCILCNLPVALAAHTPELVTPFRPFEPLRTALSAVLAPRNVALVYRSRGPPLAG